MSWKDIFSLIPIVSIIIVVNCFQKLYLWHSETTCHLSFYFNVVLWIAFKNCIFDILKQRNVNAKNKGASCELLSKIVSLTFWNNSLSRLTCASAVVNCFQKLYLWHSETTLLQPYETWKELWIAFKNCIFDFQKQPSACVFVPIVCCELLSKFVSLTFRNSYNH